jgi:hypothetical protein
MIEDFIIEKEDPNNSKNLENSGWRGTYIGMYENPDFPDLWVDVNSGYIEVYSHSRPPRRGECPGEYDDTLFWGNFNGFKIWLREYKK